MRIASALLAIVLLTGCVQKEAQPENPVYVMSPQTLTITLATIAVIAFVASGRNKNNKDDEE